MQRNMEAASTVDAPTALDQVPPQLFCLRWNNYQSNLTNVFDQLLQNESFVDVTLACGDGHSVKAHKMVLSACSPYFQTLFFENPCKHPIVILKDVKWIELKAAVDFMYKGEINVRQEQIGPLLKVAESLKIRGLADVNNEHDLSSPSDTKTPPPSSVVKERPDSTPSSLSPSRQPKRRRTSSPDRSSTEDTTSVMNSPSGALELVTSPSSSPGLSNYINSIANSCPISLQQTLTSNCAGPNQGYGHGQGRPHNANTPSPSSVLPVPLPPQSLPTQASSSIVDDMDIRPGIAEMIREEERAKMLESSQAWLNASASSVASDSYQYQLQSMWQKCWSTNQSLVHNLRFRERGPLKSWRPETMAEAILSVLKEGLSLSQAARKYDIPYPTFVLYANRVHNMLGPSADGNSDLRPKGRGRPQRILLGFWPEEHIQNVIRAVVFRDPQHIKDEPINLGYSRLSCFQDGMPIFAGNSPDAPVSPNSSAAAAVVAMAQGLRQHMLAAAAAHNADGANLNFFQNGAPGNSLLMNTPLHSPTSSPPLSPVNISTTSNNNIQTNSGSSGIMFKSNGNFPHSPTNDDDDDNDEDGLFQDELIQNVMIKSPKSHLIGKAQEIPMLVVQQTTD